MQSFQESKLIDLIQKYNFLHKIPVIYNKITGIFLMLLVYAFDIQL